MGPRRGLRAMGCALLLSGPLDLRPPPPRHDELLLEQPEALTRKELPRQRRDGPDGWRYEGVGFDASSRDGEIAVRDRSLWNGRFDLTDLAMRAHGQDPYRVEKQRLYEETAEQRWGEARAAARRRTK